MIVQSRPFAEIVARREGHAELRGYDGGRLVGLVAGFLRRHRDRRRPEWDPIRRGLIRRTMVREGIPRLIPGVVQEQKHAGFLLRLGQPALVHHRGGDILATEPQPALGHPPRHLRRLLPPLRPHLPLGGSGTRRAPAVQVNVSLVSPANQDVA